MQSKINLYSSYAVAGGTVASSVNGIIFLIANSFTSTVGVLVGQNYGAKKYHRVKIGMIYMSVIAMSSVFLFIFGVLLFKQQVFGIFSSDLNVLQMAYLRMESDLLRGSFLQPLANLFGMALSAMGYAALPMLTNVISVVISVLWATVIYPLNPSLEFLYLVFPVTSILTGLGDMLLTILILRNHINKKKKENYRYLHKEEGEK